ncbi:MAG: helix-turn-helix domain-containing protein [bacterium]|nr:helix-turn-helix domain-containing protein [bacterium]
MNSRSLKAVLADQLEAKNITIEQLSAKTDVPEQYVKAIFNNQPELLPALPYIRNYLLTIADFLGVEREIVLEAYRAEFSAKMSGHADRLPGNRFALEKKGRKWIWLGALGLIIIIVLSTVLRSAFFGAPYFRLVNPPQDAEMFEVGGSTILLTGTTESNGKLSINGEPVTVRADGSFEFEFPLVSGLNMITFTVERFLGKTLTVVKKVYVRPIEPIDETATSTLPVVPAMTP